MMFYNYLYIQNFYVSESVNKENYIKFLNVTRTMDSKFVY